MASLRLSLFFPLTGLVLTACGGTEPPPVVATQAPQGVSFTLEKPQAEAWTFLEEVAARCWLDSVLAGAAMVVDRQTGRIIIVGETETLVEVRPVFVNDTQTRVQLLGQVIDNDARAAHLVSQVRRAEASGDTAC